jgi:uncharacterized protein YndB with AHSA1/START domain
VSLAPLELTFEIACPPDHAFEVWTRRLGAWWPPGHTTSGDPGAVVTLEPHLGGRIFERTPDGRETEWGRITAWEPPNRLGYQWHIGRDASQATDVELRFVDQGDGTTRLQIVHRGWERLGADGEPYRQANTAGWNSLIGPYRRAAEG